MTRSVRVPQIVTAVAVVVGLVATLAGPASATVPYGLEADRGRLTIGSLAYNVPATLGNCPVDIDLTGTIDTATTTDNIDTTLAISAPFTGPAPVSGSYILLATGTSTGTNRGDLDPATGAFTGLVVPTATFAIRALNPTTCALGSTACMGTFTLTLAGSFTLPLSTATASTTSTAGTVTTTNGCGFPWGFFVTVGTALTIGAHPSFPADPGMLLS